MTPTNIDLATKMTKKKKSNRTYMKKSSPILHSWVVTWNDQNQKERV